MPTSTSDASTGASISYQGLIDAAKETLHSTSDTPRIDAEILLQHAINQPLSWLIAYGDSVASAEHTKAFYELVAKRHAGQPVAYLMGEREFWSLTLKVNEHVLIPRPDTETLVEAALDLISNQNITAPNLLDLGTGSGAIALSLGKELKNATVTAVDLYDAALQVAKANGLNNKVSNVEFSQSRWYDSLAETNKFDLIASNPPYIDESDPHLEQGDLRFEPITALTAPNNGLADLEHIICNAARFLNMDGWVIVEHGYNQAEAVEQLFKGNGFNNVRLYHDLNQLPRCTAGQLTHK